MNEAKHTAPRFAIIDDSDGPMRRNVCQWVAGVGYCYMMRGSEPSLKDFDGMEPSRPTSLEAFGFAVHQSDEYATFVRVKDSTATYPDGKPRNWQDRSTEFALPLVTGVRSKALRNRKQCRS